MRSPRFRHDPRRLELVSDPGGAPRIAVPHMLPAAVCSASASTVRIFRGSIQSSSSRCVRFAVADDPATLATGRALPPTRSTGWIAPASPGAHKQTLSDRGKVAWSGSPLAVALAPRHYFYDRCNEVLAEAEFDEAVEMLCQPYYKDGVGRPSIPPGRYFRMLFVGQFEGLESEREIAWRCANSLSLHRFLRLAEGRGNA